MKRPVRAAIILSLVCLLFARATPVNAATLISEPSFETTANWTYSTTEDWNAGALSDVWKTQGSYSYLLSATNANIGNDRYCQILQSVNFTSIDTLCFDARLWMNSGTECEARCIVGAETVWLEVLPTTAANYTHQEVDLSGYAGVQDLIFQIFCTAPHSKATCTAYFDNIKLWGSCSDLARTTVSNDFTGYGDIVYMYGENFDTTGTYKVAYYDGGTNNDGVDGTKVQTDTYTDNVSGISENNQCRPADYGSSSYGTWHAVVYKTTATMPASYDLVSTGDAAYAVTDNFTVQQAAIPEFPTVMAGVMVAGLCFGIYYWMRKRKRANV